MIEGERLPGLRRSKTGFLAREAAAKLKIAEQNNEERKAIRAIRSAAEAAGQAEKDALAAELRDRDVKKALQASQDRLWANARADAMSLAGPFHFIATELARLAAEVAELRAASAGSHDAVA